MKQLSKYISSISSYSSKEPTLLTLNIFRLFQTSSKNILRETRYNISIIFQLYSM